MMVLNKRSSLAVGVITRKNDQRQPPMGAACVAHFSGHAQHTDGLITRFRSSGAVSMKLIPLRGKLGTGLFTAVSDSDFAYLSQWRWYVSSQGYVVVAAHRPENRRMHRIVAMRSGIDVTQEIDHRDCDKLNNTRENLRACNRTQNIVNRKPRNLTTGIKGVRAVNGGKYEARITVDGGTRISLGRFTTAEQAGHEYRKAAEKHFGDFARTN